MSFTGPSRLAPEQEDWVRLRLADITHKPIWRSGGAFGVDTLVTRAAERCHLYYPDGRLFNEALLAEPSVIATFAITGGYRQRNHRLVKGSGRLHAFVFRPTFYRSGEWMTINIARKLEVPYELHIIPNRKDLQ